MMHWPTISSTSFRPDTLHTSGVSETNVTGRPEVAVVVSAAVTVNGPVPMSTWLASGPKVMVCCARLKQQTLAKGSQVADRRAHRPSSAAAASLEHGSHHCQAIWCSPRAALGAPPEADRPDLRFRGCCAGCRILRLVRARR